LTFIIADAGPNWRNIGEAKQIIKECCDAGVDSVKFQAYQKGHPAPGHPRAEEIDQIVITNKMAWDLYQCCKDYNLEFLCTPMYPDAVAWLAPLLKRFKVRFADRENKEILNQIGKYRTDKEVLVSINEPRCDNLYKYLYCIPDYPPRNLPWDNDFSRYDGFSSHYKAWQVPAQIAKVYNLEYLEVHVMLDEYTGDWAPIDEAVSLSITDLKKLVKVLK